MSVQMIHGILLSATCKLPRTPGLAKEPASIRIESSAPYAPKAAADGNGVLSRHAPGFPAAPRRLCNSIEAATRGGQRYGEIARSFRRRRRHVSYRPCRTWDGPGESSSGSAGINLETVPADGSPRDWQTRSETTAHLSQAAENRLRSIGLHAPG